MNETLIYGLATIGVGFLALVVRYGFKSKCSDVNCCFGIISIKRDIAGENQAEQLGSVSEEKV
jgi:hypothetical protein